jgi:uncharacterized membrane protein YkvA (DUF1232 family)
MVGVFCESAKWDYNPLCCLRSARSAWSIQEGKAVARQDQTPDVKRTANILSEIVNQIRLIWRLINDPRVPLWVKFIPPLAILYLISPIDLIPDPVLGLGQLDDLAILLLGFKVFVELCPPDVRERYREELAGGATLQPDGDVVDTTYRVVDDK